MTMPTRPESILEERLRALLHDVEALPPLDAEIDVIHLDAVTAQELE